MLLLHSPSPEGSSELNLNLPAEPTESSCSSTSPVISACSRLRHYDVKKAVFGFERMTYMHPKASVLPRYHNAPCQCYIWYDCVPEACMLFHFTQFHSSFQRFYEIFSSSDARRQLVRNSEKRKYTKHTSISRAHRYGAAAPNY